MSTLPPALQVDPTPTARDTSVTRTRLGTPLALVVRLAWIALAGLTVVTFALAVRAAGDLYRIPKPDPQPLIDLAVLSPDSAEFLTGLGVALNTYAALVVALEVAVAVTFFATGAVIFWRKSDDWMAAFVSQFLILFGAFFFPPTLALAESQPEWALAVQFLTWLAWSFFVLFCYLFPDGRFSPRWLAPVTVITIGLTAVATFFPDSPVSQLTWHPAIFIAYEILIFLGANIYAQVHRYRRVATPSQRQQIKWVVLGIIATFVTAFALLLPDILFQSLNAGGDLAQIIHIISGPGAVLTVTFIPLSLAFSVFRYRLWDVDFIISRGLVYGVLTVLLAAVFAGSVISIQQIFQTLSGGTQSAIAVSMTALLMGALFLPSRRWLQRLVDRHLYHISIDYQQPQPAAPATQTEQGRTRIGPFTGLVLVAQGGMAEVYRGTHPTGNYPIAVKLLPAQAASDPEFRQRFEREARVLSALTHRNIIRLEEFGASEGAHYIVMEYIAGRDLGELIREAGPLPLRQAQQITADIANALDYAHAHGVVHRDVKPTNVLLDQTDGGRAVLTDFGIARIVSGGTMITRTGVVGTFDYIAPEQIKDATRIDGRADIYSLGVMAYQMLTGQLPFRGGNPAALLLAHLGQPAPDPRALRPELAAHVAHAIWRAMDKNPDRRFSTAGAFAAALVGTSQP